MKKLFIVILAVLLVSCASQSALKCPPPTVGAKAPAFNPKPYLSQSISVKINHGSVDFHDINGYAAFNPVTISLKPNQSTTVTLEKAGDNFFESETNLKVDYKDGVLYLDGDDQASAVVLPMASDWIQGQTYTKIDSHGSVSLRDVTVSVKLN